MLIDKVINKTLNSENVQEIYGQLVKKAVEEVRF